MWRFKHKKILIDGYRQFIGFKTNPSIHNTSKFNLEPKQNVLILYQKEKMEISKYDKLYRCNVVIH